MTRKCYKRTQIEYFSQIVSFCIKFLFQGKFSYKIWWTTYNCKLWETCNLQDEAARQKNTTLDTILYMHIKIWVVWLSLSKNHYSLTYNNKHRKLNNLSGCSCIELNPLHCNYAWFPYTYTYTYTYTHIYIYIYIYM